MKRTKVIHSQTRSAWNVVGVAIPGKYKVARVPYVVTGNDEIDTKHRLEALKHAEFISHCFNDEAVFLKYSGFR